MTMHIQVMVHGFATTAVEVEEGCCRCRCCHRCCTDEEDDKDWMAAAVVVGHRVTDVRTAAPFAPVKSIVANSSKQSNGDDDSSHRMTVAAGNLRVKNAVRANGFALAIGAKADSL